MTRQRTWQLRKKEKGLCLICGKAVSKTNKTYCDIHREAARKRALEYYYKNKGEHVSE